MAHGRIKFELPRNICRSTNVSMMLCFVGWQSKLQQVRECTYNVTSYIVVRLFCVTCRNEDAVITQTFAYILMCFIVYSH